MNIYFIYFSYGAAEAKWGGVGEAGEQGQLLFFWGDTGYIYFYSFLLKVMTKQIPALFFSLML
jgi:hypothetical protein